MKFKGLLFLALLFSFGIYAQTDFRSGYVILPNEDTIYGKIDYRGDISMGKICKFQLNGYEKEIIYTPGDIISYRFTDSKYFVVKEVNGKKVFLEFLINGLLNIYYQKDSIGKHYFIEKSGLGMNEIPYKEEILNIKGKDYLYKSTTHKGVLLYYLQESPSLQKQIQGLKKPDHFTLIKLAKDYQNEICSGTKCIVYEKKLPFLNAAFEVAGGIINYNKVEDLIDKTYFHGVLIVHLWMPRTNEKLFFRTGVLLSRIQFKDGIKNMYKFPFQIEYVYPKGIIRPKVSYGINIYNPFYQSVSITGGLNLILTKNLSLSLNTDVEFNPSKVPFLPNNFLSYSLFTGLIYQF